MRYMDDGRKVLQPCKKGWRWRDGTLVYSVRWENEDHDRTGLDITKDIIKESINGIYDFLDFTVETGDEFEDGWLPTLDTSLRVSSKNIIEYKYFEKPTTTNSTIRQASAMSQNPKIQCLSNDMVNGQEVAQH